MLFEHYISLLQVKEIAKICSKSYGFELLIVLYNQSINNDDIGIEETYESIKYNRSKRPAFLNFINELEDKGIIHRTPSLIKKSKVLLRLNKNIIRQVMTIIQSDYQ